MGLRQAETIERAHGGLVHHDILVPEQKGELLTR